MPCFIVNPEPPVRPIIGQASREHHASDDPLIPLPVGACRFRDIQPPQGASGQRRKCSARQTPAAFSSVSYKRKAQRSVFASVRFRTVPFGEYKAHIRTSIHSFHCLSGLADAVILNPCKAHQVNVVNIPPVAPYFLSERPPTNMKKMRAPKSVHHSRNPICLYGPTPDQTQQRLNLLCLLLYLE